MKELNQCIGITVVHPTWQRTRPNEDHFGWTFFESGKNLPVSSPNGNGLFDAKGCTADTINKAKFIRDLYEMSSDTLGKYTVPILWDKKNSCIVNNESSEIIRMLNSEFNQWASGPFKDYDFYPDGYHSEIDAANTWIYSGINNGVYKCGFAKTQSAYNEAVTELYSSLDRLESILQDQKYVIGNVLTEADIRLFMTLVRFDEVHVVYFKCNVRQIRDYPNIRNYCRELYQLPHMDKSIDMDHIKTHYFSSHSALNIYAIIPEGPNVLEDLRRPSERVFV